jgi:hypothetical protein
MAKQYTFEQLGAFIQKLPGHIEMSLPVYTQTLSRRIRSSVARRYRSFTESPSGISLAALTRGKRYGPLSGRPSRRPLAAESVMQRLANAVVITPIPGGRKRGQYRIHIDPKARHPHGSLRHKRGVPLGLIAFMQESRRPVAMQQTHLMRAYMIMLREGRGGYGTPKKGKAITRNFPTGKTLVIVPPDRPVWSHVIRMKIPKLLLVFGHQVAKGIMQFAVRHGGKPMPGAGG